MEFIEEASIEEASIEAVSIEAVSIEAVSIVAPACGLGQPPDTTAGLMGSLAGTHLILHVEPGIMAVYIRASIGVASIVAE